MDLPANKASTPKRGAGPRQASGATTSTRASSNTPNTSPRNASSGGPRVAGQSPHKNKSRDRKSHSGQLKVRTTLKTLYCYRIAIRLPPQTLRQFPRKFETSRVTSDDPNAAFVTLIVPAPDPQAQPDSLAFRARALSTLTSTSPPSLVSGSASTPSAIDPYFSQRTPVASDLPPLVHLPAQSPEELLAAAGSALSLDPSRQFPPFGGAPGQLPLSVRTLPANNMGPVKDTSSVHMTIKDVIQHLSEIQMQTHGYVPETQDLLVDKMTDLAGSLSRLQTLTSQAASPNNYIHQVQIAPEIVDYVDDGRNPDIFTRDFVENVQRGNAVINGKQHAFREFSEIYAKALKEGIPEVSKQVDRVMQNAGFATEDKSEDDGPKPSSMNGPSTEQAGR